MNSAAKLSPSAVTAWFNQRWDFIGTPTWQEKALLSSITFTFGFYLIGALYLVAPLVGWTLAAALLTQIASPLSINPTRQQAKQNAHWLIILWCCSAILLEIALIVGHVDFNLGFGKIIKSTIGWAKGWALLSLFIVLGYAFQIRYRLVCRAACIVGLLALIVTPFLVLAYVLGLPDFLYVSPLKIFGGAGAEFFTVILYEIDPGNGAPRWRFFAPWAPAVGFVANIYFLCAWFEKDQKWRAIGLAGNAIMIVLAASRMGMIVMLLVPIAVWGLSRLTRPWVIISACVGLLILAVFSDPIFHTITSILDDIKGARADSTRVRATLGNIALYRWESEAYWFGHGVVERGTHLVEFMPIGSHHNWYGLLFVKGMVGLLSFLVPFALTTLTLLVKAQYQVSARLGLGMCLILGFFSMSENIEALAYMTWPAWLLIGAGLRSTQRDIDTNKDNILGQFWLLSREHGNSPALAKHTTTQSLRQKTS
ncbi:O-antigen ligase domain-containing protein [Arenicella xantha]|uniref:O-antigen ligase n=1 Tax=Arenicella xantha TaxID=644221 RepID=A0A395JRV0_9GAMM|nr:O-antigen ligase domain-containing protein [Arenicella xantha]RBP51420.1 hypothetical protein DFR28_102847 [Arenicella xantha]